MPRFAFPMYTARIYINGRNARAQMEGWDEALVEIWSSKKKYRMVVKLTSFNHGVRSFISPTRNSRTPDVRFIPAWQPYIDTVPSNMIMRGQSPVQDQCHHVWKVKMYWHSSQYRWALPCTSCSITAESKVYWSSWFVIEFCVFLRIYILKYWMRLS